MGSRIVDLGEGRFQIRAGSDEEAARLMAILRRRAQREGKEATLEASEVREERPTITGRLEVRTDLWRRAGAKIALAAATEAFPPGWSTGADAVLLRAWLRDRDPSTSDGTAPGLVPQRPPAGVDLSPDDEHVVFFMRFGDGITYVVVSLFGRSMIALPVESSGKTVPTRAWRIDWRRGTVATSTLAQLVVHAVDRTATGG
jgi:hypothetical protein